MGKYEVTIGDTPLSKEHQEMISKIKRLPVIPILPILLTESQKGYLHFRRAEWQMIGLRLDYLQKLQAGFRLHDPLYFSPEGRALHPRHQENFDVVSRREFAVLNLVINGFDIIKAAAISEGRNFPFNDPRELFCEMCHQHANDTFKLVTGKGVNRGTRLGEDREVLVLLNAFYRRRLEPNVQAQILVEHKEHRLWSYFYIYAIWDYCLKKPLKHFWEEFLSTHKAVVRMYNCTKPQHGLKNCNVKWNGPHGVISETGKPAIFKPSA